MKKYTFKYLDRYRWGDRGLDVSISEYEYEDDIGMREIEKKVRAQLESVAFNMPPITCSPADLSDALRGEQLHFERIKRILGRESIRFAKEDEEPFKTEDEGVNYFFVAGHIGTKEVKAFSAYCEISKILDDLFFGFDVNENTLEDRLRLKDTLRGWLEKVNVMRRFLDDV